MKVKVSRISIFSHLMGIFLFLEMFFSTTITVASFRFEWSYFLSFILLLDLFLHKKIFSPHNRIIKSLYGFIFFCLFLFIPAFIRYSQSFLFTGIAHTGRMILLFVPFIWILLNLDESNFHTCYSVFRRYIFIMIVVLLIMGLVKGGISNSKTFTTNGIGKNSLGYYIVCFALLFSCAEKKTIMKKPFPVFIWFPICFMIVLFTKSGTAVAFMFGIAAWLVYDRLKLKTSVKILLVFVLTVIGLIFFLDLDTLIKLFDDLSIRKLSDFFYNMKYSGGTTLGSTTDLRINTQLNVLKQFDLDMAIGRFYYFYFAQHGYTAHQLYLQILYDTGIIGIFLFLRFCVKSIVSSHAKVEIAFILLYSCVEVFLIQNASLIIFALLIIMPAQRSSEVNRNGEFCYE